MARSNDTSKPPAPKGLDTPYIHGDAIPAPEAVEHDGDSGWALFSEISRQHDARFQPTVPTVRCVKPAGAEPGWASTRPFERGGQVPRRTPAGAAAGQAPVSLDAAMLVARRNNRVCPRPQRWAQLAELLPVRRTLRGQQPPPAPVTGVAWSSTPPLTKRLCFRGQIKWAEREGVLEEVMAFMQALPEEDWLHMDED